MTLVEWAARWRVPDDAFRELCLCSINAPLRQSDAPDESEARVQSRVRLEAAQKNMLLYRNNRGAGRLESGNYVRFGLCNDSEKIGDKFKSADLIGVESVFITHDMVGTIIGRFTSVECKPTDWKFSGTLEEIAQISWATIINSAGGRAVIVNRDGLL